jgi:hypothetical protein
MLSDWLDHVLSILYITVFTGYESGWDTDRCYYHSEWKFIVCCKEHFNVHCSACNCPKGGHQVTEWNRYILSYLFPCKTHPDIFRAGNKKYKLFECEAQSVSLFSYSNDYRTVYSYYLILKSQWECFYDWNKTCNCCNEHPKHATAP